MDDNYHPGMCVECGTPLRGNARIVTLDVGGRPLDIPGLWRCTLCELLIEQWIITSNIDIEEAFSYLAVKFIPESAVKIVTLPVPQPFRVLIERRLQRAVDAASALADHLEAVQAAEPEEGEEGALGRILDSIEISEDGTWTYVCPNCTGKHDARHLFELLGIPS